MLRIPTSPRPGWQSLAAELGFNFHTMYGEPYWDETAYYQFTLKQIEEDIEAPTEELHQMCLAMVDKVVRDESLMQRLGIPNQHWDAIAASWHIKAPSLYSRLDLAYNGKGHAKLFENNADTPTSLYETGFWQWIWLEDKLKSGELIRSSDQFNILQDYLIERFEQLARRYPGKVLHFCCCKDTEEDRGTVQYLQDCASDAGLRTAFVYVEDIGVNTIGQFVDNEGNAIRWMFKLYPWEYMFVEDYGELLGHPGMHWLEPMWKAVLSNKGLLPLLWQEFEGHPNLLPAFFADDPKASSLSDYVVKPFFSREGANISIFRDGEMKHHSPGPYLQGDGEALRIVQQYHPLPKFGDNHTLIGSWLVNDKAAGIAIREDSSLITQDLSRFLPHIILG